MTDSTRDNTTRSPAGREDLLIEIGCEELPPKALDELRSALFAAVSTGLAHENINFDSAGSKAWSTPRRLALLYREVVAGQADQEQTRRGPALSAAFDDSGQATPAALGFARSVGKDVSELDRLETDKGSWLTTRIQIPGKSLDELIFPLLEQALHQLPIPRPMRWANHDFSFIRPVHWLLVMYGERVLPGVLFGQHSSNTTMGHRIHAPGPHTLAHANEYLEVLENARVLADQETRIKRIEEQLLAINPASRIDAALLAEVNNLVEWPVAVGCTFDEAFLAVPHEALVASMQDHQRFFPVNAATDSSAVTNQFIAVANLESSDVKQVREGFERVIRPRLADARFFLDQDQKLPLGSYFEGLEKIVFQNKIGTIGDKSKRIGQISTVLADYVSADRSSCERVAQLCKCDLMTQMVGEFPELQGCMGRHYALHSGETPIVADAIEQHYLPRFSGDRIPVSKIAQLVGLADRADTLVGVFTAGLKPSGNKDPFALRRSALGLVRILLEADLEIPLDHILDLAASALAAQNIETDPSITSEVHQFITERAKYHFRQAGYGAELINAAVASGWRTLPDLHARLAALAGFLGQDSGASLAAANKRIGNILRKADIDEFKKINEDRLIFDEERDLFEDVCIAEETLKPLLKHADYAASLQHLSQLRPGVDLFFDAVMVMDEDQELRANRLALLSRLKALFDQIADLSVLG